MGTLKIAALCMSGALACSPATATGFSTITQSFYSYYGTQGGGEIDEIFQYNGPLRLYKVTISWSGSASAGFEDQSGQVDGVPYTQDFDAGVYYAIYGSDSTGNLFEYGGGKSYSGSAPCSTASCAIGFDASGVDVTTDTFGFVGSGTLIVDGNLSYIDPNFCCDDGAASFVNVGGTVTYLLGPVPEPTSWTMLVAGFGLAGTALRRRPKVAAQFA